MVSKWFEYPPSEISRIPESGLRKHSGLSMRSGQHMVLPVCPLIGFTVTPALQVHFSITGSVNPIVFVSFKQENVRKHLVRGLASSRSSIDFLSEFFPQCGGSGPTSCPCSNHHSLGLQFIRRAQKILLIYAPFVPRENAFGKM